MTDGENTPSGGIVNQMVRLADLAPHPRNYNRHDASQIADLRKSLRAFGQVRSIVVQDAGSAHDGSRKDAKAAESYLIVAGHGLVEAAKAEGLGELRADVVPAGWSEAKVLAYLAADNELGKRSSVDEEQLAALVAQVQAEDEELAALAAGSEDRLNTLVASIHSDASTDVMGGGRKQRK